jgi:hypothetical protein
MESIVVCPWSGHRAPVEDGRVNFDGDSLMFLSVAALLFVGMLLVALGLFVAGNMLIVIVGVVALFGAAFFEASSPRRVER